ncbi:acyltransferase family protein [Rhizobium etli]|uniref:Peptidoglycan/LPS O-acetylase OafA/YrhL n=1 Tax=Rhizobium etli TaxID=29449 RepID=A0A7W6Y8L0_RHIET|nr:acyltransferase [Rhizobium etli]MBB4479153.1 peptidoglycan/LPS O-acetylase OafA/YrhL [Rhizobium etli]MBB4534653.1 peptidoglycan/LPS O-acetylase OafA/YrhL [Rhizobium etli]
MSDFNSSGRVGCLDGLRGLAALWVLIGHAHLLTGFKVPVIGDPDLGVDLFIMLSGFLMVFHYQRRKGREPWEAKSTWITFWVRRYFRIAPLYYAMLIAALTLGPFVYDARMVIDAFNGVRPQLADRYLDSSLANYIAHLTFLFGLSRHYAYRTALPDWSIGLEMQFYAALPFIMMVVGRFGWVKGVVGVAAVGGAIAYFLHRTGYTFPMPTFLPLKLHIFAAGMLLAGALWTTKKRTYLFSGIAGLLVLVPVGGDMDALHHAMRIILVLTFFALIHTERLPYAAAKMMRPVSEWLGKGFFHNLGELSFGAYLIHLLVMQPVVAYLIKTTDINDPTRWALTLLITVPIVYGLAWVGYKFIEMPGQSIGRELTKPRVSA